MELNTGELIWFHDGMVVGPGLLEAVGEQVDRLCAFRIPDQKTGCGGADSANDPKHILHCEFSFGFPVLRRLDAERDENVRCYSREIFLRQGKEQLHFRVWIRFASVVRLVSGLVLLPKRW
jgi:hypothetical protein